MSFKVKPVLREMVNKYIGILRKAEFHSGIESIQYKIPYKRLDKIWIRADKPLSEIYRKSLNDSELEFWPNIDYKVWANWILTQLKLKKGKHKFSKLLGIQLNWLFTKKVYLPLQADIIYYRHHATIMVYTSPEQNKVIKVALTKWGKTLMKSEIESQKLAGVIGLKGVFIPAILMEFHNEQLSCSVQEFFKGKRQSFKNKVILQENYHQVFQFLLEFYFSNPIELKNLADSQFLNLEFVEEFISNQNHGKEVISIYKNLSAQNKKMILCRIHGDLNHNNVLSNRENVCLIDWERSKHNYLFRDLDNTSFDTRPIFEKFMERSHINAEEVYPYHEQLFLENFIEMCRWIHNGITRKSIGPGMYKWVNRQNKKLIGIKAKF